MTEVLQSRIPGGVSASFGSILLNHVFRSASSTSNAFISLSACAPTNYIPDSGEPPLVYNYYRRSASGFWDIFPNSASISACALSSSGFGFYASGSWGTMKFYAINSGSEIVKGVPLFYGCIGGFDIYDWGRYVGEGETLTLSASKIGVSLGPPLSPVLSASLLKHYLNSVRLSSSAINLWLGLYTFSSTGSYPAGSYISIDDPLFSGSSEITASDYTRLRVGPSGSGWTSPTGVTPQGSIKNTENIIFSANTSGSWGWIYGLFINSASQAGDKLLTLPMRTPIYVTSGAGFMVSASYLKISIT